MSAPSPIKLGSAATGALVPETGATITVDEFNTQTCQFSHLCGNAASVAALIPVVGAVYTGSLLPPGFYLDKAGVEYLEGLTARLNLTYLSVDTSRPPLISVSNDTRYETIDITVIVFNNVPVPEPTVLRRYTTATAPGVTLASTMDSATAEAAGFPAANAYTFHFPWLGYNLVFLPSGVGWVNIRFAYDPICGARYYRCEELWKRDYYFAGFSPYTPP